MDIKTDSLKIAEQLNEFITGQYLVFDQLNEKLIENCQEHFRRFSKDISVDFNDPQKMVQFWTYAEDHFQTILKELNSYIEVTEDLFKNNLVDEWQENSIPLLTMYHYNTSLPYDLQVFDHDKNDPIYGRISKIFARRFCLGHEKLDRLLKKKPTFLENGRKVQVDHFLAMAILIPAADIFLHTWQRQMRQTSELIKNFQIMTEHFRDDVLAADAFKTKERYTRNLLRAEIPEIFKSYTAAFDDLSQSMGIDRQNQKKLISDLLASLHLESIDQWNIAGTPLLPAGKFAPHKNQARWRSLKKKSAHLQKLWKLHLSAHGHDLVKDLELAILQLSIVRLWFDTRQIIKNKFYAEIVPRFNNILQQLKKTLDSLHADFNSSTEFSDLKNKLLVTNRKLVRSLREDDLPELLNLLDPGLFSHSFSGFIKRIGTQIETLSDPHIILTDADDVNQPPRSKSDEVAVKDLITEEIVVRAAEEIEVMNNLLHLELDAASRQLARMDQVLAYNLEGSLTLIREKAAEDVKQEVSDLTISGLERVMQNVEEITGRLREQVDISLDDFDKIVTDMQEEILALADNEKVLELKLRLTRAKTRSHLKEQRQRLWAGIRGLIPTILNLVRKSQQKIKEKYTQVQKFTGLSQKDTTVELTLTQYLAEVEKKISSMPYIYQRLFRTEPLEDRKFFVGREDILKYFQEDFDAFRHDYEPVTALVGEKGNGKTTVLNLIRTEIFKGVSAIEIELTSTVASEKTLLEYFRQAFGLPSAQSFTELIDAIIRDERPRICIIENLHSLFLRTIDGFDAIHQLLLLMSRTRLKVYWIVSCGLYAWTYLDAVLQISSFFKRIIYLEGLNASAMQDMILDRHQISGFGINFIPTDRIRQSRQYKKIISETQKQEFLQQLFFKRLTEAAEGNIRVAIYLWLSSIDSFTDNNINLPVEPGSSFPVFDQLSATELFSLAGFIQHENLDESQHARIFNQSVEDSMIMIEKLYKKGLILKSNDRYFIHPYFYRVIVKTLNDRNML